MQDSYRICGGNPLNGEVELSGAKNIALKVIIAATLFDQEVILDRIPRITDVFDLLALVEDLGGTAKFIGKNQVLVDGRKINKQKVELSFGARIRSSFLFFSPLLRRFRLALIPNPGGCRIGARPIDRVVAGLRQFGVVVNYDSTTGYYRAQVIDNLSGGEYSFPKPSHTGTELLILTTVLAEGKTFILKNSAREPEIDNLILFLKSSGAEIVRHGDLIQIKGVKQLKRSTPFAIASDRIEAATYAVAGLATRGSVIISPIEENYLHTFIKVIKEVGAGVEQLETDKWRFFYQGELRAKGVETAPHPGFITDWQPLYAVLMTQAQGEAVIHERIYENRFSYVEELKKLGADIEFIKVPLTDPENFYHFNYDPKKEYRQAIRVRGGKRLHNGVLRIADLRAGATLVIAALVADGESVVYEVSHLERGYENFIEKVTVLGGKISKE